MTDCLRTDIRDVLPDWVHGSLDEATSGEVAAHVATCAACSAEVELLRAMRGVLPAEPSIDVDRIAAGVVARTAGAERPRRAGAGVRWRVVAGGLAVAASIAFGVLVVPNRVDDGEQVGPIASTDIRDSVAPNAVPPHGNDSSARRDSGGAGQSSETRSETALPEPELRVAVAQLQVSGGLADLEVDQLEALLQRLESIEALPQTSPATLFTPDIEVR